MKSLILSFTLALTACTSPAQTIVGGDTGRDFGDPQKFEKWIVSRKSEYQGMYHFGFSEGESLLYLIIENDSCYAYIKYGEFVNNGYQFHAMPLNKVRIEGNKFFSDLTDGEFMIYDWGTRKSAGLVVHRPWKRLTDKEISEFGFLTSKSVDLNGRYPFTSYRILNEKELYQMGTADLRIMRNEIFARKGYKFRPGGDMDVYFRKQSWFRPRFDNVDHSLTEIDKKNIEIIRMAEKQKLEKRNQ